MYERGVRISRPCAAQLLACMFVLAGLGCGETDDAIFIVLDTSAAEVPDRVDSICLGLWDADPTGGQFGRRYALDESQAATLAVAPGTAVEGRLVLQGYSYGQRVALHQQSFDWTDDEVDARLSYCAPGAAVAATRRGEIATPAESSMAVSHGPEGAWIVVASPGSTQIVKAGATGLETQNVDAPTNAGAIDALLAFDVDGDCDDDVLVLGADGPSIWRRERNALVLANGLLPEGAVSASAAVAVDYDRDLFGDVALVGADGLTIWQGSATGFAQRTSVVSAADLAGAAAIAAADLDGDGAVDLAVARSGEPDRLLYGDGNGGFVMDAQALPQDDRDSRGIAIADIDGDGVAEVLVASLGAPLAAFARDAGRQYVDRSFLLLPNADVLDATGLVATDWNGDCEADLLVPGTNTQSLVSEGGGLTSEAPLRQASAVLLDDLIGAGGRDALLLSGSSLSWWRR